MCAEADRNNQKPGCRRTGQNFRPAYATKSGLRESGRQNGRDSRGQIQRKKAHQEESNVKEGISEFKGQPQRRLRQNGQQTQQRQAIQKVHASNTPQSPVQAKNDQAKCSGSARQDGQRHVRRTNPEAQERQQRGLPKNNDGECAGQKAVAPQTNNQRRKKQRETQRLPKGRKNRTRLDGRHRLQIGNGNYLYRIAEPKPQQAFRHKKQQELRRPVKRIDARQPQD